MRFWTSTKRRISPHSKLRRSDIAEKENIFMYHEVIQYTRQRWKSGMVPQYADFWKKLDEFERRKCTIGLLGEQSSGKSSFLNALILSSDS